LAFRAFVIAGVFYALAAGSAGAQSLATYRPVGDAIPASLTGRPGDAVRGRAIVVNRQKGLCLLCHTGPFTEERFQGDLAPTLAGSGRRLNEGQIRLRLVDPRAVNAETIMPSYYRIDGLNRVGAAWQGKPVLTAEEIEDVVAFLLTLKD
jgi:sulfur-oxidizing protein SoxX